MTTDRPVIREIMTKAVCGKGNYKYQRSIDLEVPISQKTIQVLGNFVSNAALEEATVVEKTRMGKAVQVKGHYDVHVWYAYDQDTRAAKTTVTFIEYIPIKMYGGESLSNEQASVEFIQKPRCNKAYVKSLGDKTVIRVEIEHTMAAQVVGLTKLKVSVVPGAAAVEPVVGQELTPPQTASCKPADQPYGYCLDLKCEEDLPEEDEDYSYFRDEY